MEDLNSASLGVVVSLLRMKKLDELLQRTNVRPRQLREALSTIKTNLEELSRVHDPPQRVSYWMKEARELSYDMVDFVEASGVDANTDRVNQMIFGFKTLVDELIEGYKRYNLQSALGKTTNTLATSHCLPDVRGREPHPVVLVGIDGPTDEMLQWLKPKGDDTEKQLKIVSIHGVEGVGKSTLAQKLWHKMEGDFKIRAFIQTAKKPDMSMILTNILSQVRPEGPPENFLVPDLIQDIRKHLQNKRYFIVIDDLWTLSVWDVLRRAFPDSNCCSRLVITTTSENIALACCSYEAECIFRMGPLDGDPSKTLFSIKAFGSENGCPPQVSDNLDEITRKCGGLPLALVCLAGVVARLRETPQQLLEYFQFLYNNLRTNSTAMEVLNQVLKLCYSSLPHSLKTCLLYLSVYPMSHTVVKEDLVKQWMAEGFICALDGMDIEEVARSHFDELVNLNLIQLMDISNRDKRKVTYRVHPVVHYFITCNSMKDNFITIIDYTQTTVMLTDKIRRLALHFGSETCATPPANIGLSKVRSFIFMGLMSCMPSLEEFKLVRVTILHFQGEHGVTTFSLKEISKLFLLRYLQVRCGVTVILPDQVKCLKHLETLEVNAVVVAVPLDIVDHPSLKHVRLGRKLKNNNHLIMGPNTSGEEAVFLDFSSGSKTSPFLQKLELLPPICLSRLPPWVQDLKGLRVLEIVVRELRRNEFEFFILSTLQSLTALSLYVRRATAGRVLNFPRGALSRLKYLKIVSGVLLLSFQEGAVYNLEKLKIGFNIHGDVNYGNMLLGIDHLLKLQVIMASIGAAEDSGCVAAESALRETISKHPCSPSLKLKRMEEPFDEEHDLLQIYSSTEQKKNQSEIQEEESSIERPQVLQKLPHTTVSVPPDIEELEAEPSLETADELGQLNPIMTGSLQAKLQGLLELDHALPSNIHKDISFIYNNLETMRQFMIDDYNCSRGNINDSRFKDCFKDFRELAFDIEDFVDLCTLSNDTAAAASKNKGLLTRIRSKFRPYFRPGEILTNLPDIKRRVAEQHERLRGNILGELSSDPLIRRSNHQTGTICFPYMITSEELVGMAGPTEEVSKMVMETGETAKKKIISIVGMAGSGKTTLAAEVYMNLITQGYFQRSAFISMGQKPNMDSQTLKDMLLQFDNKNLGHGSHEYDNSDILELTKRLRELLRNSRYLLVLDDMWRAGEPIELWRTIEGCFQVNNLGSRIIITTRSTAVAMHCSSIDCIYKIGLLTDIDSKSLFLRRVFGKDHGCPNHLEAVSAQIIRRCGGLPLALISVASSLKLRPPTQEEWERHSLSFLSSSDGKYLRQILSRSYNDDLPPRCKICMLYLSIFPEHHEVEIERLMRLWIAEGFIIWSGVEAEKTAQVFVEVLISKNIVQTLHPKHNGIPTYCRVHPVMHDFIVYKSIEENLVTLMDASRQDAPANNGTIRRLSHQSSGKKDQEGSQIASADLSHARTIIVFGQADVVPPLTNLRLVRVLDLDGCRGPVCLDGLHKLLLLRYLSLRDTDVCELPETIGELRCLETLDVRSTKVKELPNSIVRLENLKHLLTENANLRPWIWKMKALQTLSGAIVTNSPIITSMKNELGQLKDMRELDLSCDWKEFKFYDDDLQRLRQLCMQGTLSSVTFNPDALPMVEILELKFKECISCDISGLDNLRQLKHVLLEFPEQDGRNLAIVNKVRRAAGRARLHPQVTVVVNGRTIDPLPPIRPLR